MDGIFTFKEEQRKALKAFLRGKGVSTFWLKGYAISFHRIDMVSKMGEGAMVVKAGRKRKFT